MNHTITILNQVLPVPILIILGYIIAKTQFLSQSTTQELRKIVIHIALPAVLFISFLDLKLELVYAAVFLFVFVFCIILFGIAKAIQRIFNVQHEYFAYLLTGFEYGMLGISLFGTAYGIENIGPIAVIALGHEVFIWFVFLPLLLLKKNHSLKLAETTKSFLTSPVIIAIVLSLVCNVTGLRDYLYAWPVTGALLQTGKIVGYLTVPVILIFVGYGISLDFKGIKKALPLVAYRLILLIPAALLINKFFIREMLNLSPIFEIALFSFFILPPPFIIPLYTKQELETEEKTHINNVLTLHTLFSIAVYIIYFLVA